MDTKQPVAPSDLAPAPAARSPRSWEAPRVEVISLACEITAYAPDDQPLF